MEKCISPAGWMRTESLPTHCVTAEPEVPGRGLTSPCIRSTWSDLKITRQPRPMFFAKGYRGVPKALHGPIGIRG